MNTHFKMAIGIDPGLNGAIVSFSLEGSTRIDMMKPMPIEPKLTGKGNQVNAVGISLIIQEQMRAIGATYDEVLCVGVEQVHANPGQGVTAMFSFGRSLGVLYGILAALRLPVIHVRPAAWKKRYGLAGKDRGKAASLALFQQRCPQWQIDHYTKEQQIGIADAYFIGIWAIEEMNHA